MPRAVTRDTATATAPSANALDDEIQSVFQASNHEMPPSSASSDPNVTECEYDINIPNYDRPTAPNVTYDNSSPTANDGIPDPDIDMIEGIGSVEMLTHILDDTIIVQVGGYVPGKKENSTEFCISRSPFELWIPKQHKDRIAEVFAAKRNGYIVKSQHPTTFTNLEYRMIGSDLFSVLKGAGVTSVRLYSFGMKASLNAGANFIQTLRCGDSACEISYDIAFTNPLPQDRPNVKITPLCRLNGANIRRKFGNFRIFNHSHTQVTQMTSCMGDGVHPKHSCPSFGSVDLQRFDSPTLLISENTTESDYSDQQQPNFTHPVGAEYTQRAKIYSTLHHAAKAVSRINPSECKSFKAAKEQLTTWGTFSKSKFMCMDHCLRFEISVKHPKQCDVHGNAQYLLYGIDLEEFFSHAWPTLKYLRKEVEVMWLSTTDLADDMFWISRAVSEYKDAFLPSALHFLNPFCKRAQRKLETHHRKFYGLVMASFGLWNEK